MVQTKSSETKPVSSLSVNFHKSFLLEFNNWRKYFAKGNLWVTFRLRKAGNSPSCHLVPDGTSWAKKLHYVIFVFLFLCSHLCKKSESENLCLSLLFSCLAISYDFFLETQIRKKKKDLWLMVFALRNTTKLVKILCLGWNATVNLFTFL